LSLEDKQGGLFILSWSALENQLGETPQKISQAALGGLGQAAQSRALEEYPRSHRKKSNRLLEKYLNLQNKNPWAGRAAPYPPGRRADTQVCPYGKLANRGGRADAVRPDDGRGERGRTSAEVAAAAGMVAWLAAIPEEMWWLFGAGYLGYAGLRTWDKTKGK